MKTEDWKRHFSKMAGTKSLATDDEMYIVKHQLGRGLGRQAFGNTVYKLRPNVDETQKKPVVAEIISPAAQVVAQAKALTKTRKKYSKKKKKTPNKKSNVSNRKQTPKKKVVKKQKGRGAVAKRKNRKY